MRNVGNLVQEFTGRGARRMPSAVKRRLLAVGALGGAALSNKALAQTELMRDGGTFELAADVSYELLESGAAQITDALGQVLEIAPEHFMVQDGQLYLPSSMYSAVGGKVMAVGDATTDDVVIIQNFDASSEDSLILTALSDTSHILISTEVGVGVTVMSQGGSPETINIRIEGSETVSDYDVSINASGELLIA